MVRLAPHNACSICPVIITSTSDLQPSTAISNLSLGKSILNKFKPY